MPTFSLNCEKWKHHYNNQSWREEERIRREHETAMNKTRMEAEKLKEEIMNNATRKLQEEKQLAVQKVWKISRREAGERGKRNMEGKRKKEEAEVEISLLVVLVFGLLLFIVFVSPVLLFPHLLFLLFCSGNR